jgi:uncharacterized protein with von Willebrand factor type A (vWA) domain
VSEGKGGVSISPDPRASVRIFDELMWSLRRDGFDISTAQAIDVIRAVAAVGVERPSEVRDALAAVVVQRASERDRFDALFDRFFAGSAANDRPRGLRQRLAAAGFDDLEWNALQSLLASLVASDADKLVSLLGRGAELDRALAAGDFARDFDAHAGKQLGFLTHRLLSRIGSGVARQTVASLRALLRGAMGSRGDALADALARELDHTEEQVRAWSRERYEARVSEVERKLSEHRLATTPFAALTDAEVKEVRRAVQHLAEKLHAAARARAKRRAFRGRIDAHRTIRSALRTAGVPFRPARKSRRRERPKLVVLCDISESVRPAACFLLEFTYAVQELFDHARTFVFVSDLGEATDLFSREPIGTAIAQAWAGAIVRPGENSNYGRVLRAFEGRYARDLDRRTTVLVVGDGRTNYHDAGVDALEQIRRRSRALLWLCPEPRSQWGQADSAMAVYARQCTAVYEVSCAADLERAAIAIVARA